MLYVPNNKFYPNPSVVLKMKNTDGQAPPAHFVFILYKQQINKDNICCCQCQRFDTAEVSQSKL
jgi:hypothetical protein